MTDNDHQPELVPPLSDEPSEDTDPSGESIEVAEDPFEGWPAAESAAVIEDVPEEGTSVEHVRGEVDVPDGYTVLEGTPLGNRRSVGVVVSRFNGGITNEMLRTALDALIEAGVSQDGITVMPVPGAFELPLAAMAVAKTRRFAPILQRVRVLLKGSPTRASVCTRCLKSGKVTKAV